MCVHIIYFETKEFTFTCTAFSFFIRTRRGVTHIIRHYDIKLYSFIPMYVYLYSVLYMFYDTLHALIADACVHGGNAKVCYGKNAIALLIFVISALKVPRGKFS